MTAAVTIMQATDWSKYSFEEWCRQLGAWINGDNETMVMVVKTLPTKRITQQQRERLLAMYMSDETLRGENFGGSVAWCGVSCLPASARVMLEPRKP